MKNLNDEQVFNLMMETWKEADNMPNMLVAGIWICNKIDEIKNNSSLPIVKKAKRSVCVVCGKKLKRNRKYRQYCSDSCKDINQ